MLESPCLPPSLPPSLLLSLFLSLSLSLSLSLPLSPCQGTIGMEILHQTTATSLDAIFVCCGGGGMLAGIASYVKLVRPEVKVWRQSSSVLAILFYSLFCRWLLLVCR